ncbi:MAG: UPF0175 family protein [Verrucomicrobia bacterium]|nr:UPF0175 family protein [Verrucomicrobiota bacterium]
MPAATVTMDPRMPAFVSAEEARLMLSIKLFEVGRLSLGQAAALAAYSKRGFIDVLARHGVPVVNYPAADLTDEIAW